jgi:hypothetical protein
MVYYKRGLFCLENEEGGKSYMIKDDYNTYIGFTGRQTVKLHYLGENVCDLYINREYKGLAPFDYTANKLRQLEKKWLIANRNVKPYKFKDIKPYIDMTV